MGHNQLNSSPWTTVLEWYSTSLGTYSNRRLPLRKHDGGNDISWLSYHSASLKLLRNDFSPLSRAINKDSPGMLNPALRPRRLWLIPQTDSSSIFLITGTGKWTSACHCTWLCMAMLVCMPCCIYLGAVCVHARVSVHGILHVHMSTCDPVFHFKE